MLKDKRQLQVRLKVEVNKKPKCYNYLALQVKDLFIRGKGE